MQYSPIFSIEGFAFSPPLIAKLWLSLILVNMDQLVLIGPILKVAIFDVSSLNNFLGGSQNCTHFLKYGIISTYNLPARCRGHVLHSGTGAYFPISGTDGKVNKTSTVCTQVSSSPVYSSHW